MKEFKWDRTKEEKIKKERGVSFDDVLSSKFMGAEEHPTRGNQIVLLFKLNEYVWVVPCVEEEEYYFVKTMFPSRKYTRKHTRGEEK